MVIFELFFQLIYFNLNKLNLPMPDPPHTGGKSLQKAAFSEKWINRLAVLCQVVCLSVSLQDATCHIFATTTKSTVSLFCIYFDILIYKE